MPLYQIEFVDHAPGYIEATDENTAVVEATIITRSRVMDVKPIALLKLGNQPPKECNHREICSGFSECPFGGCPSDLPF